MNRNDVNRDPAAERASFTDLLKQLAANLAALIHNEIELMAQGIREKANRLRNGVLLIAVATIVACAAFLSLCAAAIIGLSQYMAPVSAALVTAAICAVCSAFLALTGYKLVQKPTFEQNSTADREKENGDD
jgi:uncharacterized membrane protein YqjE